MPTDAESAPQERRFVESDPEIWMQALRFVGLIALIEGVLIVIRWVLLPGIQDRFEEVPTIPVGGSIALEFAWVSLFLAVGGVIVLIRPRSVWTVRLTVWLTIASALLAIARRTSGLDPGPGGHALATVIISMTAGASLLPWSPRQTILAAAIWVGASTASYIWIESGPSTVAAVFVFVAVTVPAIMIACFRSTRLQDRFAVRRLSDRYERVREELSAARQIHENAFPQPRVQGEVRFAYEYRPMSQIGGDYVFASIDDNGDPASAMTLVLLDVTGHGIAAALTVNRLQGELARLTAEHPDLGAGGLLEQLNRYVYLTLAEQSVFVTAVAIRVLPQEGFRLEIANAGHPPILIRRARGTIESVGATATVLGALEPDEYRARAAEFVLETEDSVIAFTDGVTEARARDGSMFGTDGVRSVLNGARAGASERWPSRIARAADVHAPGDATDDTLIVEMYRVSGGGP